MNAEPMWEDDDDDGGLDPAHAYPEPDRHVTGRCRACGEPCTSVTVDYGIGAYEYHGARGYDSRPAEVSPCCEDVVVED